MGSVEKRRFTVLDDDEEQNLLENVDSKKRMPFSLASLNNCNNVTLNYDIITEKN